MRGRRTTNKVDRGNGVYDGKVEFKNPNPPPDWIPKSGNNARSTFFPDDWSPQKIDNATTDAFNNRHTVQGNKWFGNSDGVEIMGYMDRNTGDIVHGFPNVNQF